MSSAVACHYVIKSRLTNQVLDVDGGSMKPGSRVVLWLTKNWSSQLWYDDPETGAIRFRGTGFFLCLEDDALVVKPFSKRWQHQLCRRSGTAIRSGEDGNRVVDVTSGRSDSNVSGTVVTAKELNHKLNQQFDFIRVPGLDRPYVRRHFFIVSQMNNRVLDVKGESSKPGTEVIAWPKKSPARKNQLWYFDALGIIRSVLNDFLLETQQGSTTKLMPSKNSPSQEWTLVENAVLSKTGECLEIREDLQKGGGSIPVVSSKFYDTVNQEWRLEFV